MHFGISNRVLISIKIDFRKSNKVIENQIAFWKIKNSFKTSNIAQRFGVANSISANTGLEYRRDCNSVPLVQSGFTVCNLDRHMQVVIFCFFVPNSNQK